MYVCDVCVMCVWYVCVLLLKCKGVWLCVFASMCVSVVGGGGGASVCVWCGMCVCGMCVWVVCVCVCVYVCLCVCGMCVWVVCVLLVKCKGWVVMCFCMSVRMRVYA